ncbi:MAG: ribonuclease J [Eubacterium sp.]|nr:ribonuclease J [Eubacterium sp.]
MPAVVWRTVLNSENKETVKIIPLGGLEQIGMNITAIEYKDDIIVIDGGLSFPDDDMLGIDLVIPDITYLKDNKDKIRGMVVTHGHEDHIGAIPYIEKEINIPIYTTKLTMGLIDYKLTEHGLIDNIRRKVVTYGQIINLGIFRIEFIRTNHSIADSCALAIYTPAGIIVHTGDFKVDYTPVFGGVIDLQRFGELGKKGVLALMADSTNVERPGYTPSEKTVGRTFDHIFDDNRNHRLIIATFASNVDRVQQIINSAYKYSRKVIVEGRSMVNVINIASELGYLKIPDNTLISIDEAKEYPDEKLVYITTGSQGENMAALSRIAASVHNKISIQHGDVVIFSSSPIPGNEKSVYRVMNELEQKGARVIYHDTHVSGHACQEELKLIYALTRPKYSIPVHGEYRHLKRHAELAQEMGIDKKNVKILKCGEVLEIGEEFFDVVDKVPAHGVFVDGLGVGDVGNIVIRDRQHLSENGLIVVAITLDSGSKQVLAGPDIVSRGFVYVREAELLIEQCKDVVSETIYNCLEDGNADWNKIKNSIKDDLGGFLWERTKRNPMILPIISEV